MPIPLLLIFGGDEMLSICREHQNRDIVFEI